jgi:hypothetical protein
MDALADALLFQAATSPPDLSSTGTSIWGNVAGLVWIRHGRRVLAAGPGKKPEAQMDLLQKMYRQWPFFRTLL